MSMNIENQMCEPRLNHGKTLSNEQLVLRIQAGDNSAENMLQLWQQNKGYIVNVARKFSKYAEMEDLEQEGYIALCNAVQGYKIDQGMSFISYATFICVDSLNAVETIIELYRCRLGRVETCINTKRYLRNLSKSMSENQQIKRCSSCLMLRKKSLIVSKKHCIHVMLKA